MPHNYCFRNCLLLAVALLGWASVGCTISRSRSSVSPKQLGLNRSLHKFVGQQNNDRCDYDKRYNIISSYRFSPEVTSAPYLGLISVRQGNRSHSSTMYFLNGKHRITLLDLRLVRCGSIEYFTSIDTTAEKVRQQQVVETALRRHAKELPDSLQQRIRQHLQDIWK